jgi:agmatinase
LKTLPNNFLGLPARYADYRRARFVVLPVPYDSTATYQTGSRHGPAAIIQASQQVELFDDELGAEFHEAGVATLDPAAPNTAGPEAMHEDLFRMAREIVHDDKFLIGLGGEHGISSALVRAVMTRHRKLSVLQIDAHADLRDTYQGTRFSHACVMRRIVDLGAAIVPVGIRNLSSEEHRFIRRRRIPMITARNCHTDDTWMDRVLDALGDTVYVTIDVDGFDPAYAPGTGTPEPGGLDWYDVTGLLRLVAAEKRIVGADVVEVVPVPGQAVTEFLAARLAYKIIAYCTATGCE